MAPFVNWADWFASLGAAGYYDAAPHYPATVPLTQVWGALLVGRWDDALVNFPWWVNGLALGLAVYGALEKRSFRFARRAHRSLARGVAADPERAHRARRLRGPRDVGVLHAGGACHARLDGDTTLADGLLALLLVAACLTIKNPGKVWVLTLLPGIVVALSPRFGLRIAGAGFALAAMLVAVLAQTRFSLLGYQLQGQFRMPWSALSDAYLMYGNWNLLWYGLIATAVLGWRHLLAPGLASLTVIVAAGLMFLFFGFAVTNAGVWVEDQSTVNRATLHLAPLLVVWMMLTFRSWLLTAQSAPAPGAAGAG